MTSRHSSLVLSLVVGLVGPLAIGCADSAGNKGTGGSTSTGGTNTGGAKTGGTNTGGTSTGGTTTGGAKTGGTSTGGTSTGGTSTGGTSTGGTSTGGTSTGGTATGGTSTGGTSTGGTATGGTSTGGTSTGGTATGGTAGGALGECTTPGTVSNFDDGTMAVRDVAKTGLTGALWDKYSDKTGNITLAVEDGGPGTCGPKALHITGSGFQTWGGGAEFFLNGTFSPGKSEVKPTDLGSFVGIRFKAKLGAGHKNPVRIHISTPDTEGKTEPGGKCDPAVEGADGCYNHMGRFFWRDSDNAGLSMPMSAEWKTYTFCFDRDLFPKWLPSNLSA
jgi:hypothetical protein